MTNVGNLIRTHSRPDCCVCGAIGEPLYQQLRDNLFGAPGEWGLKKCSNPRCGLVWLDPMPVEADIGKAYKTYYTHVDSREGRSSRGIKEYFRALLNKIWGLFLRVTPIYGERKRLNLMYLDRDVPGRVLEIGCGSGSRLAGFRAAGWEVEGQEVDVKAAKAAQQRYSIDVCVGSIDVINIPDNTFDAIIMNHVIEHVHDPEKNMAHSLRLLKPGGKLVVVTPNINSVGHKYFGKSWRGLEPPRHIHIFSCNTLRKVAQNAGFCRCSAFTTMANAQVIASGSFELQKAGDRVTSSDTSLCSHIAAVVFQMWAMIVYQIDKESGEECVLVATK